MERWQAALLTLSLLPSLAAADAFQRITPEAAGYSKEKLVALAEFLDKSGSESLLLLHDGKVFFEWGDIRQKRVLHSMRKALLSSLIGIAESRGQINLDATLAQLDIDDDTPLTAAEKKARVVDVLASRSGVYLPAAAESAGMAAERPPRHSAAPGERYYYNNWDFNVAGFLFEKASGRRIYDALLADIAKPLGMLDYQGQVGQDGQVEADGFYQTEPGRSRYPAYHLRLSAHDLALYGQLWLQRGQWQGRQLIPAGWVDRSTQPISIVEPRWGLAYGLLWDVLVPEPGDERPSFFHTGIGVHMLGIYPKHQLVMVHRVNTEQEGYRFTADDLLQVIRQVHGARQLEVAARPSP